MSLTAPPRALWIWAIAAVTAYYALGLWNVYSQMTGPPPASGMPGMANYIYLGTLKHV